MRRGSPRPVTTRIEAPTQTREETRRYIEITPAETTPNPREVQRGFKRLYAHLQPDDSGGVFGLFGEDPTTLEWLLVSAGGRAAPIRYLVGTTDDSDASLSPLETILRSVFPNSYELDRVECHPGALLTPATASDADATGDAYEEDGPYVAGVTFTPDCSHPLDWQTRLATYGDIDRDGQTSRSDYRRGARGRTPNESRQSGETDEEPPLAGLVETMATAEFPIVYQVLLRPKADWSAELEARQYRIKKGRDTAVARLLGDVLASPDDGSDDKSRLSESAAQRLDELRAKDARRSFEVTARAAVVAPPRYWETPQPVHETARTLATALSPASHTTQAVTGRVRTDEGFHDGCVPRGQRVLEALIERERAPAPPTSGWQARLGSDVRALVADLTEAPALCVLGGAGLPATAQRALDPTESERTSIVPPAPQTLQRYRGEGMYLGHVKDADGQTEADRLVLPPELQTTHSLVLGKSGSGKSVLAQTALRTNHEATDGPTIIVDRKGDGLPEEYLQTHYREYGDLDDVLYFDCSQLLPALSILDIRPDLEAGRTRVSAIEDRADFLEEVLRMRATEETYERSIRSPDILQYLLKAGFDTVHGDDVLTYAELQGMVTRLQDQREPPPASHPAVADGLTSVAANASRSFDDVMEAVKARLEKLQTDNRLYRLFNYAPEDRNGDGPLFSFDQLLEEDVAIVFDTSDMREDSQKAFVLVLLAQLWDALKRREQAREDRPGKPAAADGGATQRQHGDADADSLPESSLDSVTDEAAPAAGDDDADPPLVNLFIEEAAEVAASDLVTQFLRQARGFNCAVTLAMQFPEQLRHEHPEAYEELLNDVSTVIAGNVGHDRRLAERFATDDMPADAVANRLRALEKGEWLVTLPAPFGDAEPRPFLMESAPLPPGHPDGPEPLSPARETAFEAALDVCQYRTGTEYGLSIRRDRPATTDRTDASRSTADSTTDAHADADADTEPSFQQHELRSALPHTKRLPEVVTYDADAHSVVCAGCDRRYAAAIDGLQRAIECCNSLDIVDRDDIPVCDVPLTLTPEECLESAYSIRQVVFLQAVVAAKRGRYDTDLEYDLRRDSMVRLREYVGIDQDAVDELVADGLVNRDGDHPHRLYTVTDAGLDLLDERRREGITHGDGIGDLGESSLHRVMVLDGAALLEQEFVDDAESAAVEVRIYYETDGYRYDAVALNGSGEIVAAVEAERTNHDLLDAAPEDFDKLAAVDPEAAIWIVENRSGAHAVLKALNNPNDNVQRVEKTYSESTAPRLFKIDTPGLTDVHTLGYVRNTVLE